MINKETKEELQNKLREIEKQEELEKEKLRKQDNFKKFMERNEDFMVGKAHADLSFINQVYYRDREKSLMPATVSITGNSGISFQGKAPVTESTRTFFRNVWDTNYTRYEDKFQEELNALVQKYVKIVCEDLVCVLEMMGLQSNHYYITSEHFPEDKLNTVKIEIEKAQKKILNKYPDEEFIALIRKQTGWKTEKGEIIPEFENVDLSHSKMILYRYIFKNRPTLQKRFKQTDFYKQWKEKIEKEG